MFIADAEEYENDYIRPTDFDNIIIVMFLCCQTYHLMSLLHNRDKINTINPFSENNVLVNASLNGLQKKNKYI